MPSFRTDTALTILAPLCYVWAIDTLHPHAQAGILLHCSVCRKLRSLCRKGVCRPHVGSACASWCTRAKSLDMSDAPLSGLPPPMLPPERASPLFLREAEIRRGIELLFFGYTSMIRGADLALVEHGLGRAHHRALYFIARRPGMPVSELMRLLSVTKQSLSRVLADLVRLELVEQQVGATDRRQRLLRLTKAGARLEAELFEILRARMAGAFAQAGQHAVTGFWAVLSGLIPPEDRAMIAALAQPAPGG